jgi:hypothetical protein
MKQPVILKKPLTREELQTQARKGRISVNIVVDLNDLLSFNVGIDDLNNFADEKVLDVLVIGSLSDISYQVVGHVPGTSKGGTVSGSIILNVNADVSDIITTED